MKILKLKLRGAIGIRKGLGVDEIEIDFSNFQSGLIALTGRNGSGKTTIMENLHPFRTMVSRDGSLQSHFFLKDSYRMLDFEYNGNNYTSKILIDALTGGSEAYLLCNGNPLNDGKLTTYDEAIENLLGSPELFFNSVFSGQKSKGIAAMKPADRRKLFYELLNLNVYEQYLEKAKAKLIENELRIAEAEGEIKALPYLTNNSAEELKSMQMARELERINLITEKDKLAAEINAKENEIRELEIQDGKNKVMLEENRVKQTRITELVKSLDNAQNEYQSRKNKLYTALNDCEIIIENNAKLLQNKDEIEGAMIRMSDIEKTIQSLNEQKSILLEQRNEVEKSRTSKLNAFNVAMNEHVKKQNEVEKLSDLLKSKLKEIARLKKESELITDVPCYDQLGEKCPLLVNAYASKNNLGTLEAEYQELSKQHNDEAEELLDEESRLTAQKQLMYESYQIELAKIDLKPIESEMLEKKQELELIQRKKYPQLHEQLRQAKNDIEIYMAKAENLRENLITLDKDYQVKIENLNTEIDYLKSQINNSLQDETLEIKRQISMNQLSLQNMKHDFEALRYQLGEIETSISVIKDQIKEAILIQEKTEKIQEKIKILQQEIKDWNFLVKAFDKTGIPVLKLENSGVEITTIANELLSLFENKFRIVFETTKLKADKKSYKESFDINIVEEDGVCEISNKSGGQQVWLETAIQLAISLVVRQQGKNIQTSFLDEKDGALDLENALSYIEMLRKAHQMSGVHNTFIITHRPELLDFIPQQVKLADGYLQILN